VAGSDDRRHIAGLWSADTDSDSDSDTDETQREVAADNANENIPTDNDNTVYVEPVVKASTPDNILLRRLCDAAFSDTLSATSSVSSKPVIASIGKPSVRDTNCYACSAPFSREGGGHRCNTCTCAVCSSCSSVRLCAAGTTVLRLRVCTVCAPLATGVEFTPSKLHLVGSLAAASVGSRPSAVCARKNVSNRLWSADTETDSDDSDAGDPVLNLSVDSVTENLAGELLCAGETMENGSPDVTDAGVAEAVQQDDREPSSLTGPAPEALTSGVPLVLAVPTEDAFSSPTMSMDDYSWVSPDLAGVRSDGTEFTANESLPRLKRAAHEHTSVMASYRAHRGSFVLVLSTTMMFLLLGMFLPQLPLTVLSAPIAAHLRELHEDSQYHINLTDAHIAQPASVDSLPGQITVVETLQRTAEVPSLHELTPTFVEIKLTHPIPPSRVAETAALLPPHKPTVLVSSKLAVQLRSALCGIGNNLRKVWVLVTHSVFRILAGFKLVFKNRVQ
jgi:hypothetical protein